MKILDLILSMCLSERKEVSASGSITIFN
jgi:hypothetical protein